jgi:ubiquinone/menaquinone biosynthesis C-methylase UbiE
MEEQYAATIKENVKERYSKIALTGNSDCCCMPEECCSIDESEANSSSPVQTATTIGYDIEELEAIPKSSILGVGCGAPIHYANLKEGEIVVDLGSGAGIDAFISANKVGAQGKVIGIDMTDEMLEKARKAAKDNGYTTNVEFRKGDIEKRIPVEENSVDVVISNCVINLVTDKASTFKEIYRILKKYGIGRMVISDLVTDREIDTAPNSDKWCSCIDGALTKDNYLDSIKKAGFQNVEVLEEKLYMEGDKADGRKITSLVIKAFKG